MASPVLMYQLCSLLFIGGVMNAAELPSVFFPVGPSATQTSFPPSGEFVPVTLSPPFLYAGTSESTAYINRDGYLSFVQASKTTLSSIKNKNVIVPLFITVDPSKGKVTHEQVRTGPLIEKARSEIRTMFPEFPGFIPTWVMVFTWQDIVERGTTVPVTFQTVLVSNGADLTFVLLHYKSFTSKIYITSRISSTNMMDYVSLPLPKDPSLLSDLSNVGIPGRLAFEVHAAVKVYLSYLSLYFVKMLNSHPLIPGINNGNSPKVTLQQPFRYFGRNYNTIYVNKNGVLSFSEPMNDSVPTNNTGKDIIYPLWGNFKTSERNIFYEEVTSGPAVTEVMSLRKVIYPNENFSPSWLFIATWHQVSYADASGNATFQLVLASNGQNISMAYFTYLHYNTSVKGQMRGYQTLNNTYNDNVPNTTDYSVRVDSEPPATCRNIACGESEVCAEKNGTVGCYCAESNPRPNPETFDARPLCTNTKGSVSFSQCQLFEAGYSVDRLQLIDSSCKGTIQNNRLVFSFDTSERMCGGTLQSNNTHLIYKNSISLASGVNGSARIGRSVEVISRDVPGSQTGLSILVSCVYPVISRLTMPTVFQATGGATTKETLSEGTYQIQMLAYPSDSYTTPYSGEVVIGVNQDIYIALTVEGFNSKQIALVMENCWATPVNDSNFSTRWDLITNMCPSPQEKTVIVLKNGVSTSGRFSFKMFIFTGYSQKIYLHCKVLLCLLEGGNCAPSCGKENSKHQRRAVDFLNSAAITMSF